MKAYYNEIDPHAAAWLRELIKDGHIADGDVDERSIIDVRPSDLRGYTQCHFFAGIGVWSHALRKAGWADDRQVWTGSCPCQPFSSAGAGKGFADERHLWPHFHWLISQCRPAIVFGEQVASKDGLAWFDLVQADLEGSGYTSGGIDTCAAGFGAPHIRQRLYWVAYSTSDRCEREGQSAEIEEGREPRSFERWELPQRPERCSVSDQQQAAIHGIGGVADAPGKRGCGRQSLQDWRDNQSGGPNPMELNGRSVSASKRTRPTNGFWRDADWLLGRDEKWRAVEPGTFPLADGIAARVGRLRGYGNAIVAPQATAFVETVMEFSGLTGVYTCL